MHKCLLTLSLLLVFFPVVSAAGDEVLFSGDREFRNLEPGLHLTGESYAEVKEEGQAVATEVRPTLKVRELKAGGDVRLLYATPGGVAEGVDTSRTLLKIAFIDYARRQGRTRYSSVASATFGRGLLVRNYATNERKAYFAGVEEQGGALYLLAIDTHLTMARARLDLRHGTQLGVTYVQDDERSLGAPKSSYGVDFQVPLPLLNFSAYGEFAHIQGNGSGFAGGVIYEAGKGRLQWRHELSHFEDRFVPAYYDAYYEVQPADLFAAQKRTGFLSEVTIRPLRNVAGQANLRKNSGERASLHAETAAQIIENLRAAVSLDAKNYGGRINRTDDTLYQAKVIYGVNENMDLVLEYNRTYPDENAASRAAIEYTLLKTRFKI